MNIIPNGAVSVSRSDAVIFPYLRVQINWYTSDPASGGIKGFMHGTLSAPDGTDLRAGDIVTILNLRRVRVLPSIISYTLGTVQTTTWPAVRVVAPLLGGVQHGGKR